MRRASWSWVLGGWVMLAGCSEDANDAGASTEPEAAVERDAADPGPTTPTAMPVPRGGAELVGSPALPFASDLKWLGDEGLTLADVRGKVVLVRFWTDTCPFCQASAPGLTQLHERYAEEGLVVLGMFHPKPRGSTTDAAAIRARADELGMHFPIASDSRWDTLERWWLTSGDGERAATSVSFLIDRAGVIRWVHPGPELHPGGPAEHEQCRLDFADAERAIALLLAEPPSAT